MGTIRATLEQRQATRPFAGHATPGLRHRECPRRLRICSPPGSSSSTNSPFRISWAFQHQVSTYFPAGHSSGVISSQGRTAFPCAKGGRSRRFFLTVCSRRLAERAWSETYDHARFFFWIPITHPPALWRPAHQPCAEDRHPHSHTARGMHFPWGGATHEAFISA